MEDGMAVFREIISTYDDARLGRKILYLELECRLSDWEGYRTRLREAQEEMEKRIGEGQYANLKPAA